MAKWSASVPTWTPVAVADATNYTDAGHHTLQGGSATQRIQLLEVYMGGQAGASSPCIMQLGRTSTVGATLTAGRFAPLDPHTAALAAPPVAYNTSTTKPQRSATLGALLNLSYNAFGGIVRWVAAPGEEIVQFGNAVNLGELSLSAFTGGTPGLTGSHMIVEPA